MDISALSLATRPTRAAIAPTPQSAPAQRVQRWAQGYKNDQQELQKKLENIHQLQRMDTVELLQLQAMTQRFSLHTEIAARMADRLQNATRQLLSQGG